MIEDPTGGTGSNCRRRLRRFLDRGPPGGGRAGSGGGEEEMSFIGGDMDAPPGEEGGPIDWDDPTMESSACEMA